MSHPLILAIDPGPERSALVWWDGLRIHRAEIMENRIALEECHCVEGLIFIEWISSYGMRVGATVFDTCRWVGRFQQIASDSGYGGPILVKRMDIKLFHTGRGSTKDADVRGALIEKYGEPFTKEIYTPTGKKGQPLKERTRRVPQLTAPLTKDLWQAFGLATMVTEGGCK